MYLNKNYNTLWNIKLSYSAHDIFLCFICINSKMNSIMLLNDTYIRKAKLTKTCAVLNT